MIFDRRSVLAGSLATGASACFAPVHGKGTDFAGKLIEIETGSRGTLGVEFFDTGSGNSTGINRDERFGHCSSFKMSLAAMVLSLDAEGSLDGNRLLNWQKDDLMFVSPFTTERLEQGATLLELAESTQKYSDNTAANVLLRELGGPQGLTAYWRGLGDEVSRLDRIEPELNLVPPGELKDTTTPAAMARMVAKLTSGEGLPKDRQTILQQWMTDTRTGRRRVRAGLPKGWQSGDKTGTSGWLETHRLYVDIGFVVPPERAPVTFATYLRSPLGRNGMDPQAQEVLAQVGGVLADFAKTPN